MMMRGAAVVLVGLLLCVGCSPFGRPDKLFLKRIETPGVTVEWYFHSLITSTTPDVVTLNVEGVVDTVCRAQNIKDVQLVDSVLFLRFYGDPLKYGNAIIVPAEVLGIAIEVDTAFPIPAPSYRRTFLANPDR
jgi:hypothetical protein